MKKLDYPLTWVTHCFLDNGCGAKVFAHTNGGGDFVLFDELGPPWPVHECYTNRIRTSWASETRFDPQRQSSLDGILERLRARGIVPEIPTADVDEVATKKYEEEIPVRTRDIEPVTALDYLKSGQFELVGYVQDIVENAVGRELAKLKRKLGAAGSLVQSQLERKLRGCRTQITVVDANMQSFTLFADTSSLPIARKDSVVLKVRAEESPVQQKTGRHHDIRLLWPFFVCVDMQRVPRLRGKRK